jgi:ligand-binding sensor domain-containing protein/signal transduction histidine kinase
MQLGRHHEDNRTRGCLVGKRRVLTFWLALAFADASPRIAAGAAPSVRLPEYRVQQWKAEQGLPQNTVRCLHQTRDGYLWIGTRAGLVRFDGTRFTHISRAQPPGLPDDDCATLVEDRDGALWVGTESGLARWQDHRFTAWRAAPTNSPRALPSSRVRALAASPAGGMWIGTQSGLSLLRDGRFTHFTTAEGLWANDIRAVLEDDTGQVWVGTETNVHFGSFQHRLPGTTNFTMVAGQGTNLAFMVHCLRQDTAGRVWWGNNAGLHCLADGSVRDFRREAGLAGEVVRSLALCRDGGLLVVTAERSQVKGQQGLHKVKDGQVAAFDLAAWDITGELICALEDREGGIWIGTRQDGLYRLQPRLLQAYTKQDGLPAEQIDALCTGWDDSVWVATPGQTCGIVGNQVVRTVPWACGGYDATTLARDGPAGVWLGNSRGSIYRFTGSLTDTVFDPELSTWKAFNALVPESDGSVWLGQAHGLSRLWMKPGPREIPQPLRLPGLESQPDVRALLRDRTGLWVGTGGAGLFHVPLLSAVGGDAPEDQQVHHMPSELASMIRAFGPADGLGSDQVRALWEDDAGTLWVGTDNGLTRHRDGKLTNLSTAQGLFPDRINQMLGDELGYLWLGGNHGLYRVSRAELNAVADGARPRVDAVAFGEADGMPSSEVSSRSHPAACRTLDGRLWFPTVKGICVVNPTNLQLNLVRPLVLIEQVRANDRPIYGDFVASVGSGAGERSALPAAAPLSAANQPSATWSPLHLPPGSGHLVEIRYTATSFSAPGKVRFRYMLEGYDTVWQSDDQNRRVAFYTNLRPGAYTFRVTGCNNHGLWSGSGAELPFYVAPHFYETWVFYGTCAVAVVLAGLGMQSRRLGLQRRLLDLEHRDALARERDRIARDLHDQLGSGLMHIALQGELASRQPDQPGETRVQIQKLTASVREIFRSLDEMVWAVNPKHDTVAGLASYLCQYTLDFFGPAGIRCRFDLPEDLPPLTLTSHCRHNLFLAVREALQNVVKHAAATEVRLRVRVGPDDFEVELFDNGSGFTLLSASPSAAIRHQAAQARRAGNGLTNMQHRMESAGGRLVIATAIGEGTRLTFSLPLAR